MQVPVELGANSPHVPHAHPLPVARVNLLILPRLPIRHLSQTESGHPPGASGRTLPLAARLQPGRGPARECGYQEPGSALRLCAQNL